MGCKMIKILNMIIIKKFNKNGIKIVLLLLNFNIKKNLPEGKLGLRDFSLNSEKGVLTPSWRILGT